MSKEVKTFITYLIVPLAFLIIALLIILLAGPSLRATAVTGVKEAVLLGSPESAYDESFGSGQKTGKIDEIKRPALDSRYGWLTCKEVGLKAYLYYGDTDNLFEKGGGQYPGSGLPGQGSTILIGGHDISFFEGLEDIKKGDIFNLSTFYGEFKYKVTGAQVADAQDEGASRLDSDGEQLVLYTCYPFGSIFGARQDRYFVYADKVQGPTVKEVIE